MTKPNLILDLNETLVHSVTTTDKKVIEEYATSNDLLVHYVDHNGVHILVFTRPYILDFLFRMCDKYSVYLYSNTTKAHMNMIVNTLTTKIGFCPFEDTYHRQGVMINKHISHIPGATKYNTIIIDNNEDGWICDMDNQIVISEYYPHMRDTDRELLHFIKPLEEIANLYTEYNNDIRTHIAKFFGK